MVTEVRISAHGHKCKLLAKYTTLVLSSLLNTGSTLLILSLSGTAPVEKETSQISERGTAKMSIDALITLTFIPSAPSLLLFLREETILVISSGVEGEVQKLLTKEPLK